MSEKSEAERLADALEISSNHGIRREAAAELRRLHELALEQQGKIYALEMARSMEQKTAKLKQDALLKALELAAEALGIAADNRGVKFYQYEEEARAAIKKAEEGK